MPIKCAGEPAAEATPFRECLVLKRIDVVGTTALTKARIRAVDLQSARDHAQDQHERHPVRDPGDPVMSFDGRGGRSHRLSLFRAMRLATPLILAGLVSCRPQQAAITTGNADTRRFAHVTPRDSAATPLLAPRVPPAPTVLA